MLGQAERFRDLGARVEERLCRGPHRDIAEGVDRGQRGARLEVALVHHGRAVGPLDHHVRFGKSLGDVAAREVLRAGDIGRQDLLQGPAAPRRAVLAELGLVAFTPGAPHHRRVWTHRVQSVHNRGQDLVLDDDERRGVLGHGLALGDDGRHGMADEADVVQRERAAVTVRRVLLAKRQIASGEDADHARQGRGRAPVDLDDAGAGVMREHEARVERAGLGEIGGETREAGRLLAPVHAAQRAADAGHRRHGLSPGLGVDGREILR